MFAVLQRVTGVDLLRDLSSFFRSLGGMIDGFTERARRVGALLEDPATTFLIVTAPRPDPVEEAIFFHRKLREAGMPFGGLVVNRVHQPPADGDRCRRRSRPSSAPRSRSASAATRELSALAERDAANVERLRAALGDPPRSSSPSSRTTSTTSRASPSCAHTCSSDSRRSSATRRSAGSRWPQRTSRSTARRQPPSSQTSASTSGPGRTRPAIAARSSEIASRTRCASPSRNATSAQIAASRSATPS